MVGFSELTGGLSSLKAASDILKGIKSINDEADRNSAIIEIQSLLLEVQEKYLASQNAISELDEKINYLESWERRLDHYELAKTQFGFSYMKATESNPMGGDHKICAQCFHRKDVAILQPVNSDAKIFKCPNCKDRVVFERASAVVVSGGGRSSRRFPGGGTW